jgi:hypothetical protein
MRSLFSSLLYDLKALMADGGVANRFFSLLSGKRRKFWRTDTSSASRLEGLGADGAMARIGEEFWPIAAMPARHYGDRKSAFV